MVWGKPESGAWANAVEEEEQELGKYRNNVEKYMDESCVEELTQMLF
jgi:hypothetical protein